MKDKVLKLERILKENMPLAVAFSGGVDSTYLLSKAVEINRDNVLAVNVKSEIMSSFERIESVDFLKENNINHVVIEKDPFSVDEFVKNPKDKCYYCKKQVFEIIKRTAEELGYKKIADGSNASDADDYRPGMRALKEHGVISPLKEAGLTKDDIRRLSMEMGLKTWDKPSNACLATRIMNGICIDVETLERIDKAEDYIRSFGIRQVRVRVHERNLARIELDKNGISVIMGDRVFDLISRRLRELGFDFITLDMEGYKTSGIR